MWEIERSYEHQLEQAKEPSRIERLSSLVSDYRMFAEQDLESIKQLEESYERNILFSVCLKDQVNRLIDEKEIEFEYCDKDWVLEQYKTKK